MIKNSIVLMILTFLSRILGLVRTIIIATFFGATGMTDAYFSAFKISNFFRQLLGEGALGTVFIPIYNEKENKEGEDEAKKLIFSVLNLLFVFLIIITLITIFFSKPIINFIVMGYNEETREMASSLLKITAWYFVFIGLAGMISAILNNDKKFYMPAFTPILFNTSIIFFAITLSKKLGIYALAYGVVVGGILQLLILIPSFKKSVKKFHFRIDFKDKYLKEMFILLAPMLVGIFARQINTIVDQFFASFLASGTITALENATRIYNLPLGIFGISIATVIFPTLSKAVEKKDFEKVKSEMEKGLKFLMFFVIPSFFGLIFYSKDIINLLLGHGKFSMNAIKITSESLVFYTLGLFFYTAIHLMSRAFYSMKNTKTPVKFSIIAIIFNIIFDYLLVKNFRHIGLATATSVAALINFTLLYIFFNKNYIRLNNLKILVFGLFIIISSIISLWISNIFAIPFVLKIIVFIIVYFSIWGIKLIKKGVGFFE